jgi:hypothetical protein
LRFAAAINFRARATENQHWEENSEEMAYLYKPLGIYLYPALNTSNSTYAWRTKDMTDLPIAHIEPFR